MNQWRVQVFYDGDCPLCAREIALLRRLDRKKRIWFTDISAGDFEAERWGNSQRALMDRIHGRLPDGRWIEGVEVFRQLYAAIGLGALAWLMGLPGLRHALDWSYRIFARNRLRWTGRCTPETCDLPDTGMRGAA